MILKCWWCVHELPEIPCIHLPIKYNEKTNVFNTLGNFCSWQCAKAYASDMKTSRSGEIQSIIALMRRRSLGKYVPLWPAPKREALQCFGGTMTIEQFRTYGGLVEPPRIHWPFEKLYVPIIEGSVQTFIQNSTTTNRHMKAIETSAPSETDTLRLKRPKPLQRAESKLENVLGIKRTQKSTAS